MHGVHGVEVVRDVQAHLQAFHKPEFDRHEGRLILDAVVQDLEDALDFLGEVTGAITPDDVLGSIFANFCVGK